MRRKRNRIGRKSALYGPFSLRIRFIGGVPDVSPHGMLQNELVMLANVVQCKCCIPVRVQSSTPCRLRATENKYAFESGVFADPLKDWMDKGGEVFNAAEKRHKQW